MSKRRGFTLVLFSLGLGILIGFGIRYLKQYIAAEIIALLDKEARAACDCTFSVDSLEVSLLTLSARAKNAQILERGIPKLVFKELRGRFGLQKLRERKILLTMLRLIDGYAIGVGPESATFKFVDSLAAPISPEKDRPDRWKLKLQRLKVNNSRFVEQFATDSLIGEGVALDLIRDKHDNFKLKPSVKSLVLRPQGLAAEKTLALGNLVGELYLTDEVVTFERVFLAVGKAWGEFKGATYLAKQNELQGDLSFAFDTESLGFSEVLSCGIEGGGKVSGSIHKPNISGVFNTPVLNPLKLTFDSKEAFALERLSGKYSFNREQGPNLTVSALSGEAKGATVQLVSPITLKDSDLSGRALFQVGELRLGATVLQDLKVGINLDGKIDSPKFSLDGTFGSLAFGEIGFGGFGYRVTFHGQKLEIGLFDKEETSRLKGTGEIILDPSRPRIERLDILFDDYPLTIVGKGLDSSTSEPYPLNITGAFALNGALDAASLQGEGNLKFSPKFVDGGVFNVGIKLSQASLQMALENMQRSLQGSLKIDLLGKQGGGLTLALDRFRVSEFVRDLPCVTLDLRGQYDFNGLEFRRGSGKLELRDLDIGCAPYELSLPRQFVLPIRLGTLFLEDLNFERESTRINAKGQVGLESGFDLGIDGALELPYLLGFLPAFDDLRGTASIALRMVGPLGAPKVEGHVRVEDAGFDVEMTNVSAEDIDAEIVLIKDEFEISQFSGRLNGGTFTVEGRLAPFRLEDSALALTLNKVSIQPLPEAEAEFSGMLELAASAEGIPAISGGLKIESAQFQKSLDLATVLRAIPGYLFSKSKNEIATKLPNINLDLTVASPGGIFIVTSLLVAELRADLQITGDISAPTIRGELESLSGSFGIKDRSFDITSGRVFFKPLSRVPELKVLGESTIRSQLGDYVLVFAEVSGPVTDPRIKLSSDQGLSQRELLQIVTGSGGLGIRTRLGNLVSDSDLEAESLEDDEELYWFGRFVRNLAKIDALLFEPTYNSRTGTLDPAIVARKRLTDRISMIGENILGAGVTESRAKLLYDLTSSVTVLATLDAVNPEDTTSFGVDVAYTILSSKEKFLKIAITGNRALSTTEILRAARLTESSRILASELDRVEENLYGIYESEGYVGARLEISCHTEGVLFPNKFATKPGGSSQFCRTLLVSVDEGRQSLVEGVVFEGDDIRGIIDVRAAERAIRAGPPASKRILKRVAREFVQRLRSEGYIGARVDVRYEPSEISFDRILIITIKKGNPVTFTFRGNKQFSPEEFLNTINLFNRKQPFGPNTVNILVQNIERKYRQAGFLYATIRSSKEKEVDGRVRYLIEIEEEQKTSVQQVSLSGNDSLSRAYIEERVFEDGRESYEEIFRPNFAVAEELETNCEIIRDVYREEGFPDAKVDYRLESDVTGSEIEVVYKVEEGSPLRAMAIEVLNFPSSITLPEKPNPPYSIPKANRYIELLSAELNSRGYFSPALSANFENNQALLKIEVEPGPQTKIASVKIDGVMNVDDSTIWQHVKIKAGDPWDTLLIENTREALLRLGLFSRVEIEPLDGALDHESEDLLLKVGERPLQSLEVGGGINSEYGVHFFGEATDRGLFKDGRSLSLRADAYYDPVEGLIEKGTLGTRFANPYFLSTPYSFSSDLSYIKLENTNLEFDEDRISLASYFYRSWESGWSNLFGHTIFQENLDDVPEDVILSELDRGTVNISFLSGTVTFDGRDSPINPTSGFGAGIDYKLAGDAIGSDANYVMMGSRGSFLYQIPAFDRRFSISMAARLGAGWTYSNTSDIPISQRFYLGGRSSVRGFRENSLGPRGEDGNIIGGDLLVSSNFELKYLLYDAISVHLFFDTGTVFLHERQVSIDELRESVGVGARYLSPIGPVGFDIGHPLDERSGEPSVRFHFSIGTSF